MKLLIRCSQLSNIMTDPKAKGELLSVGAKTYLLNLAKQAIYGYEEEVSAKYTEKGIIVEDESIRLYNYVNFESLAKNTERRENEWITGECDLVVPGVRGIDIKSSWSLATFPVIPADCDCKEYEWQDRGYMMLWDVPEWETAYCMVDTPEELIGYESEALHSVSHIPQHMRITSITYKRDLSLERKIMWKCAAAQAYYTEAVRMILSAHGETTGPVASIIDDQIAELSA